MSPKIFFSDLDGTLLTDHKTISPDTMKELSLWTSSGNYLVLCSGRALDGILQVVKQLNLTLPNLFLIGCNGGEVYDYSNKKVLLKRTLPQSLVLELFALARSLNIHLQTYSETHILTEQYNRQLEYYSKSIYTPVLCHPSIARILHHDPCKCLAIELDHTDQLEVFKREVLSIAKGTVNTVYSNPNYLEIYPYESGKGNAVTWLCNYLHLPIENSLAAGDELNDLSMIQAAGTGIAMKNARKEIIDDADLVTLNDNNHDGLVPILQRYRLQ